MVKVILKHANAGKLGLICGLLWLSSCASTVSTETLIEERAMARWNALFTGDIAAAYEYLSPGYRSSVSLMQYQRSILQRQVALTGANYTRSECSEITCKVMISLNYRVSGALPGVKHYEGAKGIEESWVKMDGLWYYVPKE